MIRMGLIGLIFTGGMLLLPSSAQDVPPIQSRTAPVTIEFLDSAIVFDPAVTLGDVARIRGPEGRTAALVDLVVGVAPAPGGWRFLESESIYRRHLAQLDPHGDLVWQSKFIHLRTEADTLAHDSLRALLQGFIQAEYVRTHSEASGDDLVAELVSKPAVIALPKGERSLKLVWAEGSRGLPGRNRIILHIEGAQNQPRRVLLSVEIKVFAQAWIARRTLGKGEAVNQVDFTQERAEITRLSGEPMRHWRDGDMARTRQVISKGRVLTHRMLVQPPVVRRGDRVRLVFQQGAFTVYSDAECRQDGSLGETIFARTRAGERIVRGRVVDSETLEWLR